MLFLDDLAGGRTHSRDWASASRSLAARGTEITEVSKSEVAQSVESLWRVAIDDLLRKGPIFNPIHLAAQHLGRPGSVEDAPVALEPGALAPLFVISSDAVWNTAPAPVQDLKVRALKFWQSQQKVEFLQLRDNMVDEILNRGFDEISGRSGSPSMDVVVAWINSDAPRVQLIESTLLASTFYLASPHDLVSKMSVLLSQ